MKVQISPTKIVKDAIVVWDQHGPEVDIVMDPKALSFAPESVDELYVFHVLDHLFPEEVSVATANWFKCLKPGSKVFIVVDDFEYIMRGFIAGDISIGLINEHYNHPTQFTRENGAEFLRKGGFKDGNIHFWLTDVPDRFPKQHFELVLDGKK